MAKITHIDEARRKTQKKRAGNKILMRACIIIVVCAAVIGVIYSKDLFTGISFSDIMQEAFGTVGKTGSYPASLMGAAASEIYSFNGSAAVLTDTNVQIFSRAGRRSANVQHNLESPVLNVYGNKMLLMGASGKTIKVLNKGGVTETKEFENTVYLAELSPKGLLAVAGAEKRHAAGINVYNEKDEVVFTWLSSENQVMALRFSPDSSKLAVVTAGAKNGAAFSTLKIFSIKNKEELCSVDFENEIFPVVKYTNSGVLLIGTSKAVLADENGEIVNKLSYNGKPISHFSLGDGENLLVLGSFKQDRRMTLVNINDRCEEIFSKDFEENIRDVYTDDNEVTVLCDNMIYIYDKQGGQKASLESDENAFGIIKMGDGIYLLKPHEVAKVTVE